MPPSGLKENTHARIDPARTDRTLLKALTSEKIYKWWRMTANGESTPGSCKVQYPRQNRSCCQNPVSTSQVCIVGCRQLPAGPACRNAEGIAGAEIRALGGGKISANDIQAFVIHLTRAEARRPQVDRILETCPVPARVIEAVDGRALPAAEIDAVYSRRSLHAPRYPFELGVGEVGCFLSHRKAWQAIADNDLEAGLIIEDDVDIDVPVFSVALELARKHVGELGYIQFQTRPVKGPSAVVAREGSVSIVRPQVGQLRTSAQLVSAAHAARLLELTDRFDRPVDSFLQMSWVTSKPLCCAVPPGITDRTAQSGGSTISQKKPLSDRLSREIKRFVYRLRIRALSKKFAAPAE